MGKIADAYVEITASDSKFTRAVEGVVKRIESLNLEKARGFANATEFAANHSSGVLAKTAEGLTTGIRIYTTYRMALQAYTIAAKAAAAVDPSASIAKNVAALASVGASGVLGKIASVIGSIPKKFLIAAAAVGVFAVAMKAASSGVAKASDLAEQADFSKVVLGTSGFEAASEAATKLSWSYGILRKETLQTATTAASMAKNMGLSKDQAAELGIQVARLAGDLSSAANTSMQDAATAINAVFRGETDPIERYGVSIREAAIEAEALASGLARSKGEIDENVKFQARWNLLVKQTRDSQGNLAQTAGSYANVMRNVRGQLAEASTTVGEALLPLAGNFARVMLAGATAVRYTAEGFQALMTPITMASDAVNQLHDRMSRLAGGPGGGFKLFEATAAENEAKRVKRFEQELADERAKKAQEAADLKLKTEKGLLTDADKEKIYAGQKEQYEKFAAETERQSKKMLDLQEKEADLIEQKKEQEQKYKDAISESLKEERNRIAELDRENALQRARKLEDMALDKKRRDEDRNASFMFASLGDARDRMFTAAVDKKRENGRTMEDFNRDEARKREDMLTRQDEIRRSEEDKRAKLTKENSLTNEGLKTEIDRVVAQLAKIYDKFDMRME